MMHMPNMDLSACLSMTDKAPLQVAHCQPSVAKVSVQNMIYQRLGSNGSLPFSDLYGCGLYMPKRN